MKTKIQKSVVENPLLMLAATAVLVHEQMEKDAFIGRLQHAGWTEEDAGAEWEKFQTFCDNCSLCLRCLSKLLENLNGINIV